MTAPRSNALNTIPAQQNTPEVLDCQLAAQVLYRRAERLFDTQFVTGVVVPVAFSVLNLVLAKSTIGQSWDRASIAAWGALYGVVIMLLDELILDHEQKRWKRTAAVAQEMFDTSLFNLPWRRTKAGPKLTIADIHNWAERRRRVDPSLRTIRN
jgi:predicted pore-forming effector associated with SMODS systems